jgi:hypothetical protein
VTCTKAGIVSLTFRARAVLASAERRSRFVDDLVTRIVAVAYAAPLKPQGYSSIRL